MNREGGIVGNYLLGLGFGEGNCSGRVVLSGEGGTVLGGTESRGTIRRALWEPRPLTSNIMAL